MLAFESLVNALVPGKVSLVVQVNYMFDSLIKLGMLIFYLKNKQLVLYILQGYFCPVVLKYASCHQEKLSELILVNPPVRHYPTQWILIILKTIFNNCLYGCYLLLWLCLLDLCLTTETATFAHYKLMEKHAKLPSSLALFSNFLLGEIFSQVSRISDDLCFPTVLCKS